MSDLLCGDCGHEHRAKWPENYPYPDKVCPLAPESCNCFSFVVAQPEPPVLPPMMCRRCGKLYSSQGRYESHQTECLSSWVEVPKTPETK